MCIFLSFFFFFLDTVWIFFRHTYKNHPLRILSSYVTMKISEKNLKIDQEEYLARYLMSYCEQEKYRTKKLIWSIHQEKRDYRPDVVFIELLLYKILYFVQDQNIMGKCLCHTKRKIGSSRNFCSSYILKINICR